jgi:hypothetical protein
MAAPKRTKPASRSGAITESPGRSGAGMHSCPSCSSILVQPVTWQEEAGGRWRIELRCPECDWWSRDSYSQREVDRFDEELDLGAQELIEDLRALTRANMEDEMERFATALASDGILPEDF